MRFLICAVEFHSIEKKMFGLGTTELLIIGAIFVLLFGGAKLPALMRNMGRSVNEFKAGIKEPVDSKSITDEDKDED